MSKYSENQFFKNNPGFKEIQKIIEIFNPKKKAWQKINETFSIELLEKLNKEYKLKDFQLQLKDTKGKIRLIDCDIDDFVM
jgi:hypothetical protein